jgi:hypothetical protein
MDAKETPYFYKELERAEATNTAAGPRKYYGHVKELFAWLEQHHGHKGKLTAEDALKYIETCVAVSKLVPTPFLMRYLPTMLGTDDTPWTLFFACKKYAIPLPPFTAVVKNFVLLWWCVMAEQRHVKTLSKKISEEPTNLAWWFELSRGLLDTNDPLVDVREKHLYYLARKQEAFLYSGIFLDPGMANGEDEFELKNWSFDACKHCDLNTSCCMNGYCCEACEES